MQYDFAADTETDGFRFTQLHSLVILHLQTDDIYSFADQPGFLPLAQGVEMLEMADSVIGHNFLSYDLRVLSKLRGAKIDRDKVFDTLTGARLLWPDTRDADTADDQMPIKLHGKHSLEAWGHRLRVYKGDYGKTTDWSRWTPGLQSYCVQDTKVTAALYRKIVAEVAE